MAKKSESILEDEFDGEEVKVEDEYSYHITEERPQYIVAGSVRMKQSDENIFLDSLDSNKISEYLDDKVDLINFIKENKSMNRHIRKEFYEFNDIFDHLVSDGFSMIEVFSTIIVKFELEDNEIKNFFSFLLEANKEELRDELMTRFSTTKQKENSLMRFFE